MAVPEACGLWIEQRLKEEIEESGDTQKSVKAIARMVTDEVNKVFETDINIETIRTKARRIAGGSNDHPKEKPVKSTTKPKLEKLEKKKHGGKRGGSGRKPNKDIPVISDAETYARMGISQLERLRDVPKKERIKGLLIVEEWIKIEKERK